MSLLKFWIWAHISIISLHDSTVFTFRKMSLTERLLSWLHSCDFGSPACMEWCSFGSYWDRGTLFLLLSFSRMCSDCTPRLLRASHAHTQASSALMEICNQFSQQGEGGVTLETPHFKRAVYIGMHTCTWSSSTLMWACDDWLGCFFTHIHICSAFPLCGWHTVHFVELTEEMQPIFVP